jgi:hypothetical protein
MGNASALALSILLKITSQRYASWTITISFVMDPQDDGQCFHTRIVDLVEDHQSKVCKLDDHHKFCISVNDDQYEEVITYYELMDFIQKNEKNDAIVWHFW